MNIVSFEKAYCLFPPASLEQYHSVRKRFRYDVTVEQEDIGGNICVNVHLPTGSGSASSVSGLRLLGDARTWVISLGVRNITPPPPLMPYSFPLLADPAAITSFYFRYDAVNDSALISFFILSSDVL